MKIQEIINLILWHLEAIAGVSPAYGFSALALVKCSNEGGPGPKHNMKEDPGTSTLIMKREHGQEVPCEPGQVIRILGSTSPPVPRRLFIPALQ